MTDQLNATAIAIAIMQSSVDLLKGYVSNPSHQIQRNHLPDLLQAIYGTLELMVNGKSESASVGEAKRKPAVSIKDSIKPDYLVCLEDGKQMKMLKRHLHTSFGMTPEQYRVKWGLPSDYPMTSPNYSKRRSSISKNAGFGRGGRGKAVSAVA